jgi:beta-lactamase regulating signal transducer with metallopeptidase domain
MSAWLIDTLLYTGTLIALVPVLRRPVGRFLGPQIAYALWALPFRRLLLPPIVLPADLAPEAASAPLAQGAEWTPLAIDVAAEPAAPTMAVADALPSAPLPPPTWEWTDLIAPAASLWAGVALAFLAWRLVTYRRMRGELLEGARPVGEIGRVRLVETPALAAPVAFGVLDKVIALPPLFMAQHDIAARDLAIAHELAHHQGQDLLANMAAQALLALHWFNPLAWYGWRAMRRDQEAACDARVLAGRGREERLRYAALIAGIATGPRSLDFKAALAAPMACPVLGERSIVHRLRSLSMSEFSRRRRWLGRSLLGASALALPLTASISYAASAQLTEVDPSLPAAPAAEIAPAAPVAPVVGEADEHRVHTFVLRREGPEGEHVVREVQAPRPPRAPRAPQSEWHGDFDSEEFQASMAEFEREMEKYGEEWAKNAPEWEKFGQEMARMGEQHRSQALAMAEQARRNAPEVVHSCDEGESRRTTTEDGRPRIVFCQRDIELAAARSGLRSARNAIARNREISDEVRRDILEDLDEEIERIERENH